MTENIGIVWNPSKVDEEALRDAVGAVFDEGVLWRETSVEDPGGGAAAELLAAGCRTIIAVGGDGTVRSVAQELAGTDAVLGIVPRGTGNLLARNLDVPLDDLSAALERVAGGHERTIDLGWVEIDGVERAFAVMVGFGVDAQMLVETDEDLKSRAGWLAYVEAMGRALAGTEMTALSLTLDDQAPQSVRAHTLLIGNCGMLQGGIRLLPDAVLDDGRLDLLLVSADGALQWMDTVRSVVWDNGIRRLFTGDAEAVDTDSTTHLSAERIRVELESALVFEIDGEEIGEVTSFAVRVDAGALRVH